MRTGADTAERRWEVPQSVIIGAQNRDPDPGTRALKIGKYVC